MADIDKPVGFQLDTGKKRKKNANISNSQSFVTPVDDEGGVTVSTAGFYGTYVDIDATIKTESDLITKYRDISTYTEVDNAIEEITSEVISAMDDEPPITIEMDKLEFSDSVKKKINEEFEDILEMLDFKRKGHDIFRRWYIDGRIYYQKIINQSKRKDGIQKLIFIDPRKIKKVRNVTKKKLDTGVEVVDKIEEYFIYNDKGLNFGVNPTNVQKMSGIKINPDTIAFASSGLVDLDKNMIIGFLHKALKPTNQLKMMMDSMVIYRASRAPERRIFYIDVGNLPKNKAEEHMKTMMNRYKNKIMYDASTGEIRDSRHFMSMMEDYWLPRTSDGRGTQIDTLPGAQNLGNIQDVEMFQHKVYNSLNVPVSRFEQQNNVLFGRQAEVSREELKFSKFINRLRRKFNELFDDLLKTSLILKGIINDDDWEIIKENIYYRYAQDQYFQEIKEGEILRNRLDLMNQTQPYVGMYFSKDYIQKHILRMSDEEIEKEKKQIKKELDAGEIQPPMMQQPQDGQMPVGSVQAGALSNQIDNDN